MKKLLLFLLLLTLSTCQLSKAFLLDRNTAVYTQIGAVGGLIASYGLSKIAESKSEKISKNTSDFIIKAAVATGSVSFLALLIGFANATYEHC